MTVQTRMRLSPASLLLSLTLAGCSSWQSDDASPTPAATHPAWTVEDVATGLDTPWDIAWLPDGRMLVTERNGRLLASGTGGVMTELARVPGVLEKGESGLTGIAVDPAFAQNGFLYVQYSYEADGNIANRLSRFAWKDGALRTEKTLLDGLPGGSIHNGGRIRIGPDGKLWVLTGDGGIGPVAQDTASPGGKVLRINTDGTIPSDNPLAGSAVYSVGHRNPQGIDWLPDGTPFVAEHGQSAHDEINRLVPAGNYGWPQLQQCEGSRAMTPPVVCSGKETWAPSGIAFATWNGRTSLFVAGLRGSFLKAFPVDQDGNLGQAENVITDGGRMRAVSVGPDGALYVSTSNKDGRGSPRAGDDRILRITPR